MFEHELIVERLEEVLEALERIPTRFSGIDEPTDFVADEAARVRMDAICMVLIAVGEAFKTIDRKTAGKLLSRYSHVDWRGVMGVRDLLAHHYFRVDIHELFRICRDDIPSLIASVRQMIEDLQA